MAAFQLRQLHNVAMTYLSIIFEEMPPREQHAHFGQFEISPPVPLGREQ